jgi:hypothetical protein
LWLLSHIVSGETVEKVILFSSLLFSGVGMYGFIKNLPHADSLQKTWRLAAYVSAIFYMINPFIYARFMAGQWMVLLGYALLPFFLRALLRFFTTPSAQSMLKLFGWTMAVCIVSLHHIGMLAVLVVIFGVAYIAQNRQNKPILQAYVKWGSIGGVLVLVANLYWLIPLLLQKSTIFAAATNFTASHFQAFATTAGSLGTIGEVIRLQGFWAEDRQLFILPQQIVPLWGIIVAAFWAILIYGAVMSWRKHRLLVGVGITCCVVGIFLSSTSFIEWISHSFPLVAGYREPHKLVNLVVVGYCMLFTYGVARFLYGIRSKSDTFRQIITIAIVALPIIITPTMFGGFAGQLIPRTYPAEWTSMNNRLKEYNTITQVLFLPWHHYASYSFSKRIIANPAEKFFEVPMLASDNPEFKNISATIPNKNKQHITLGLQHPSKFSEALHEAKISHILLAKEQDWHDYLKIIPPSAKLIVEDTKFQLYEVKGTYATTQ